MGSRLGIPPSMEKTSLQFEQVKLPSRISWSFCFVTLSSKSPLQLGQASMSIISFFINAHFVSSRDGYFFNGKS